MYYLSDRKAVELLLPMIAFSEVVIKGADDHPDSTRCLKLLRSAMSFADARPVRRAWRHYGLTFETFYNKVEYVSEVGLIAYYWLKAITDAGYLELGNDEFTEAINLILPALQSTADRDTGKAVERATWVLCEDQRNGYYIGVSPPTGD